MRGYGLGELEEYWIEEWCSEFEGGRHGGAIGFDEDIILEVGFKVPIGEFFEGVFGGVILEELSGLLEDFVAGWYR